MTLAKMSLNVSFLVLLFALYSHALSSEEVNSYIDEVLSKQLPRQLMAANLEPAPTSDVFFNHTTTSFPGPITFVEGNLSALSNIRRSGICSKVSSHFKNSIFNCPFQLNDLKLTYKGINKQLINVVAELQLKPIVGILSLRISHIKGSVNLRNLLIPSIESDQVVTSGYVKNIPDKIPLNALLEDFVLANFKDIAAEVIMHDFVYSVQRSFEESHIEIA